MITKNEHFCLCVQRKKNVEELIEDLLKLVIQNCILVHNKYTSKPRVFLHVMYLFYIQNYRMTSLEKVIELFMIFILISLAHDIRNFRLVYFNKIH